MILISILPVLFIAGYAPIELLMERSGYLFDTVYRPSFIGYADITFWVAAICIPFIKWNGIKYALLASITVAYIMIGARQAPAGIIAFIVIDALFVKQRIMVRHWILGIAALHVLVSIIELRSGPGGLINFLKLFLDPGRLSSENVFLPINYVTNFSVIVNAYGYDYLPTDSRAFWYGVSPLPSFVHNDIEYYISRTSIRWYIPFPGLSYLFKHVGVANGCAIVFSLFFLINAARNLIVKNRDALDYAIYSTCVLVPAFFLLQYSIRAPVRLLIIMFLGYFVFSFVREHFLRSRSPIVMAHE
ncbi:hypothetical protein NI456_03735 [Brevundimonas diminuta]|uniref:hypothetical protein n=1 Tax=Brevundimonas diminuta TaxID=293 RepID=UPI0020977D01|nr:hypothetical protein [Brevundimonas diminuta]MCO8017964.1 hypothetical protein [Brevundimonas diminuta]MCO8022511.1 hypothetical protein [Brevundimonas diminuta]